MAEQRLVDAVKRLKGASQQAVITQAADQALREGTNEALTRALVVGRESANTWVAKEIANDALGFNR